MCKRITLIMIIIGIVVLYTCIVNNGNILSKTNKTLTAKDKLQLQDFRIDGLYLQQPIAEVIKKLGKPTKVETIPNKDGFRDYDEEDYYFPGIISKVYKSDQKIIQLMVTDKRFKTFRDIRVGDKEENVYLHYGKAKKINNAISYWMLISQKPIDIYHAIGFHIKNGKVTRIDIAYVPSE